MPVEIPAPRGDGNTRFAAAIFDFDETIIDLEPQHTAAYDALCRHYGCDYASMPEEFRTGSGRRIIDDIRELRAFFRWQAGEEAVFAKRQQLFDDICRTAPLEPMRGIREAIGQLRAANLTLAITSSSVASSIDTILRRLDLRDAFSLIVDGSEVVHGKPDPEAYLVTARKLGLEPRRCIVFEDSEVGVLAARRAGMYCVAVRNPRAQTRQDLSAANVIVEVLTSER